MAKPIAARIADTGVPQWRKALTDLWRRNRVHAGPEMATAWQKLAQHYPVQISGYPSGTRSGSWTAPPEWHVRSAQLIAPDGRVVADWATHPLHLYAFSPPFSGVVARGELDAYLTSDPARPNDIPFHFRNQYRHWAPEWGFCIAHKVRESLPDGDYRVEIDSEFVPGKMEMAEQMHAGESPDSLLLVGHFDHPAMCNDGLVGCLAGHEVLSRLAGRRTRLTYRMLSTVEIVGSVFYAEHHVRPNHVREALFIACAGARAPIGYQTSAHDSAFVDRAARHVLAHAAPDAAIRPFRKLLGNDEIAFDVGGVGIPCGAFARYPFAEYHSSADTPETVDDANFEETVGLVLTLINIAENNAVLHRRFEGLPCLSNPELDLYLSPPTVSGLRQATDSTAARLLDLLPKGTARTEAMAASARFFDLMNLLPTMAEGSHTTLDLAERAGVPFAVADIYSDMWVEKGLLEKHWQNPFETMVGKQ